MAKLKLKPKPANIHICVLSQHFIFPQNPALSSWPHMLPKPHLRPEAENQSLRWSPPQHTWGVSKRFQCGTGTEDHYQLSLFLHHLKSISSHPWALYHFASTSSHFVHSLDQSSNRYPVIPSRVSPAVWETLGINMNQSNAFYPQGGCSPREAIQQL